MIYSLMLAIKGCVIVNDWMDGVILSLDCMVCVFLLELGLEGVAGWIGVWSLGFGC